MNVLNKTDSAGDERIPSSPRLAIDPGVSAPNRVGSTVRIEGEIHGEQDLFVDGEVSGSVIVPGHTLTIGHKAHVKATIKARNVVLVGNVEGNIQATERVELRSQSSLLGDLRSPRIVIENGACIKGTVEVVRSETPASRDDRRGVMSGRPLPLSLNENSPLTESHAAAAGAAICETDVTRQWPAEVVSTALQ